MFCNEHSTLNSNRFTIIVIDIILYHGRPLNNANANKGLPFEGLGIKCYCTQIDRRLKALGELKMIVMEELCVNLVMHNIQITYRSLQEVLKHRINYKYMAMEAEKHVKIMFDQMERITQVSAIELYIKLEPCVDVGVEEIQQTTTSLHVTVSDAQYEYFTHVENDDDDDDDNNDYIDETAINGENFVDRDEYEERIEREDFERDIDDDEIFDHSKTDADNDAKQKAIWKIFGNWEEFYQRLQKLLLAYVD
ncbi:hypothetical protein SO802_003124 [Lithocarpus litseifolius]|uniref:Uncharacterized protein n=1 Tax=Lithocarpus litseifolius TaxID=425828 RepID=A0AAW2E395_9ROSI